MESLLRHDLINLVSLDLFVFILLDVGSMCGMWGGCMTVEEQDGRDGRDEQENELSPRLGGGGIMR